MDNPMNVSATRNISHTKDKRLIEGFKRMFGANYCDTSSLNFVSVKVKSLVNSGVTVQ